MCIYIYIVSIYIYNMSTLFFSLVPVFGNKISSESSTKFLVLVHDRFVNFGGDLIPVTAPSAAVIVKFWGRPCCPLRNELS